MTADPEKTIREVVEACADCEVCRDMMETCRVFPELYRLWDDEHKHQVPISRENLRRLTDLCNYCALCSCPDIREKLIQAKTGFIEREGLPLAVRLLEDAAGVGRICGAFPQLTNRMFQHPRISQWIKCAAGIHPDRKLPRFPGESFFKWATNQGLDRPVTDPGPKAAFFAGCTGPYLFPEVPKAVVSILRRNGVQVWVPEQGCCGMPSLLEGDRNTTLKFAQANLDRLARAVTHGYVIVTACPTCGFMLKESLCQGACFSSAFQDMAGGDDRYLMIPEKKQNDASGKRSFRKILRSMYHKHVTDDGYFSALDPIKRIQIAEKTFDLGEYLNHRKDQHPFEQHFNEMSLTAAYFPPCHLREQNIGYPFLNLLRPIPKLRIHVFDGTFDCCGMAGIMGFKRSFHRDSLQMGEPLMARINALKPDILITDCLSCRLQFQQMAEYPVFHPVEILNNAG
jgi:glycerol-3-phosphate dehydrogenase subunit C